ncbi:MAG TPA: alpha/beta hydrolase [Nocardioidaceae bacterium]|nr:alpha/beta hydrolase [Nocardioidaceae bacterium]
MEIDLPAGTIHYREYGDGEPVVFVHGFAVDGQLWEPVAELLSQQGLRCIVPTWPFGSHRTPMKPDADLAPPAAALIIRDFLEALDLTGVTIVANDSGGAVTQMLLTTDRSRIGRIVLTNCDSFENFPPDGFKLLAKTGRLPGAGFMLAQSMRFELFIRAPFAFGALNSERQPIELLRSFVEPLITDKRIRRDAMKFFGAAHARDTLAAAEKLPDVDVPALIVWGEDDKFFPISDAERLARTLPNAKLVRVPDAKTFVSLDQPEAVADAIAAFVAANPRSTVI